MAIKKNQIVQMHYELTVKGDVVDSSFDKNPLEFVYGTGQIIEGLETQIEDMEEKEERMINVPAAQAYGEHDESLSETLPIKDFKGIDLQIGMVLEGEGENGELLKATVTDVTKDDVTVDYNHPLAGCDLEFKVVIQKIV